MPERTTDALGFRHIIEAGTDPALLLLHGTGGTEEDLLPVGRDLAPGAALLSPRGQVLEGGMPRFFRRLAPGVFDLDDLRRRTHDLAAFARDARAQYGLNRLVALGYSNGANIAASLLLLQPGTLAGAILLRPMVPLVPEKLPTLAGLPVLIAAGRRDAISPPDEAERLAALLKQAGADVTVHWASRGHELGADDLAAARQWLATHYGNGAS